MVDPVPSAPTSVTAPLAGAAQVVVVAGTVALLAFDDGGYFERTWPWATVALAAVAALAVVVAPGVPTTPFAALTGAGLAAFAAWEALSRAWSVEPDASLREAERGLVYVAAVVAIAAVSRGDGGRWLLTGVLAGTAGVSAYALGRRAAEGPTYVPTQSDILNEPLGYANALGILAALALVISLGLALATRSALVLAGLAAAATIAVITLVLTSSRGSWAAAAVGAATTAVFAMSFAPWVRRAWLALTGIAVAAVLASPLALNLATLARGLSDRPYYWWAAWHALPDRPLLGAGAGTFSSLWAAHAPVAVDVTDAHSLYLETLVEVGPVGLGLLLLAVLGPLVVALPRRDRVTAVAVGAYATFLVHAGVDWDWEMPAVTIAGLACGAAVAGGGRRGTAADRAILAAACILLVLGGLSAAFPT